MEPIEFGNMEKSISILVYEIWQSPDWVDWYEDELQLNIQDGLRVEIGLQGGEFSLDRVRVGTAGLPAISGGGRDFLDAVPVSPQPQDHAPGLAPLGAAHGIRSLHDRWPEMPPRESALQGDGEHATAWARLPRAYHRARQVDGGSPIFGPGDKGVVIPVDIPAVDQATTAVPGRDQ